MKDESVCTRSSEGGTFKFLEDSSSFGDSNLIWIER